MGKQKRYSIIEIQTRLQDCIKACALCGSGDWELEPDLFTLRLGNPWVPRQSVTLGCVVLNCQNCGNTHFINVDRLMSGPNVQVADDGESTVAIADTPDEDMMDDTAYVVADSES